MTTLTYGEMRTEIEKRIDAEVLARVKKGLAWLEETHGPGWEDKIDMEIFDISKSTQCVLGQVFREESQAAVGRGSMNGFYYGADLMQRDPAQLGFDIQDSEDDDDWDALQDAWEYVIEERRA
jgi:hypothetical protein